MGTKQKQDDIEYNPIEDLLLIAFPMGDDNEESIRESLRAIPVIEIYNALKSLSYLSDNQERSIEAQEMIENWISAEFEGIEQYDTVALLAENEITPKGKVGYVIDIVGESALVDFNKYGKTWLPFSALEVLERPTDE